MPNVLLDLEVTRVDLVEAGANSEAHIKIFKNKGGSGMTIQEVLKNLQPEHAEAIEKALEEAKKAQEEELAAKDTKIETLEKELADKQDPAPEQSEEEILKSASPEVRAVIEKAQAQAKVAEEAVRKLQEKEEHQEAITKAKELKGLGKSEEELAEMLKNLAKTDSELQENIFGLLKSASKIVEDGTILDEIGKNSSEESDLASDAWDQIEKLAKVRMETQDMTQAAAIAKTIEENPKLYTEYLKNS